ncbi:hypothetical protein H5410_057253 [Solanum commersonii]|uniref:DUF4283 domain-containing protein n=1 Tax=Solanum commersonii TaxID=4109 RepID=A0A9J5WPJ7_SOLCO|nr:hypothetical protein H5410_057253 [Solanum commersonii]
MEGPYYVNNRPLVLKRWESDLELDKEALSLVPLWLKFPGLPVGYWSVEALSKVASAVGRPIHTGRFTTNVEMISFARILIEVDLSHPLNDLIVIETPSGPWDQLVEYEWRPKYCNKCLKFGHNDVECWYKEEGTMRNADQGLEEKREDPTRKKRYKGKQHVWQVKTNPNRDIEAGNEMKIQDPYKVMEQPGMGTKTSEIIIQRSSKKIIDSEGEMEVEYKLVDIQQEVMMEASNRGRNAIIYAGEEGDGNLMTFVPP